ncbi:MAG: hypothetical protein JNM17_02345 [Archangium sp.]|nr:hypothetical protein [Archangium sp.]
MLLTLATIALLAAEPKPPATPTAVMTHARGVSLDVASVTGAAVVKQGDHIDVVGVFTDPDTRQLTSTVMLQNVIVLSNKAGHVTLLLIPEEAELIALVHVAGKLSLVTREPNDKNILEEKKPATLKRLLSGT